MPSEQTILNRVSEELNRSFASFREYCDKAIETRSTEEQAKVNELNAKLTELQERGKELQRQIRRSEIASNINNRESMTEEQQKRFDAVCKFVRSGFDGMEEMQRRDLATDGEGGVLVPDDMQLEILRAARDDAVIRPSTTVRTTSRDTVTLPSMANAVVVWGDQSLSDAVDKQGIKTGRRTAQIKKVRALVAVPNDTLSDAAVNIWSEVESDIGMAIAESEDMVFTKGNGVEEPEGILTNADVLGNFVITQVADGINDATYNGVDALISLMYKVKKTYRRAGVFAMNSVTEGSVRKLKDSDGQYLWQPPVQAGDPGVLLGKPVINPEDMDDPDADDNYPVFFGDLRRGYRIWDRQGISIQRLMEKYSLEDEQGILVKKRTTGQVIRAEAFSVLKISAT